MKRAAAGLAALALLAAAAPAHAGDVFGGVLAHNADLGVTTCCSEGGTYDVQFGYRTLAIRPLLRLGDIRAHVFGEANTAGGTNFVAAGLSYRFSFARDFYVAPGLGAAIQDGGTEQFQARPDRLSLGSRVLFEPELTVGWHATDRLSVEFHYNHLSHGQLAGPQNPGVDNIGLRLAWRVG